MADAMVSTGLAKVGYEYINIDAGYLTRPRDSSERLRVNSQKFPSGIKHLADQIHAKGLKLGVYTDLGVGSCGTVSAHRSTGLRANLTDCAAAVARALEVVATTSLTLTPSRAGPSITSRSTTAVAASAVTPRRSTPPLQRFGTP